MQYNASLNELDNMFVHLTNVAIQKYGVREVFGTSLSLERKKIKILLLLHFCFLFLFLFFHFTGGV